MTELCERVSGLSQRSLSDLTFIAFDVETTGLSAIACKLVELSGVKFKLGFAAKEDTSVQIDTFSTLINPGGPIPPEVSALHGITDAMVADAPSVDRVLPQFFQWCGSPADTVLIAHNASFDVEFLKVNSQRLRLELPAHAVIDTLALAQCLVQGSLNYKLKTLSEHFGFAGSLYHRALDDSMYVQKLFAKLVEIGCLDNFGQLETNNSTLSFTQLQRYNPVSLSLQAKADFDLIAEAIEKQTELKLTYSSEFKSTRVILPLALIESRGSIYITAICRKTNSERTFRLDRVLEVNVHGA
ncbi:MAG: exonuclease domain-containing protein [Candidatus Melainabacteria bacterium]|nr:exonuclease domain-containing protein [Candidatus Melainabacteria bacterium]